ncbi:hypothetical protein WJX73_001406 [Symbiochloris irregularis]|uniref:CBM20 domain-containing protein n=1 Tax=Symbiochloris irregularis TaxID=706552 RepID=A0AAW1P3K8_9CHLO
MEVMLTVRRTPADALGGRTRFGGGVSRPMTRVRFWLNWHVEYGQAIRVVGSHENLGAWQLSEALQLHWSEGDQWTAVAELPAGRIAEYKYVLVDSNNSQGLSWQQGNNSVLALRQDDREVEVYDNWAGGPGAAVIAAGKSTTRENRLVAWAEDIERLVASQRGELRRSRMELIAAQDDARSAREETRRLKTELATAQADRQEDKMRVRELETMNKLLRTQLQDSAASFRAALETAQRYLREAEQQSAKPSSSNTAEPHAMASLLS